MTDIDTDVPTCHDRRRPGRRARTWTWTGTAVAATVAAVLLAPAPMAAADPVVPPGIPCASQIQAFYNARQALADHNDEPRVFPTQGQVEAYDAQARALYDAQVRAQQEALRCARALAGSRAPVLSDPVTPTPRPSPTTPPATRPAPSAPGEASEDDWAEKMQEKIYDWYKEQLEKVEKYEEKQQEEKEKQQEEQRHEPDRCGQPQEVPADPPASTTPTPAPPICPAAPTTTTTAPSTF